MKIEIVLYKSDRANALLGRDLNLYELKLLNYLYSCKNNNPAESSVMQDLVKSCKNPYKTILERFEKAKIITGKTNFIYDRKNPGNNRCRRYFLDGVVMRQIKEQKSATTAKVKLAIDKDLFSDTSEIIDSETKVVFDNLSQLTVDTPSEKLTVAGAAILKKFISGVRNVKKSPKTGRISHLLLNAGSKEVRKLFRIGGEKPLEIDGKSFHWQLLPTHLNGEDQKKLKALVASGFYEAVMEGTGINNRNLVKEKLQQVLTPKKLGKEANKIQKFLFQLLPSLKTLCENIWISGGTVQAFLQSKESLFVNSVVLKMASLGKWIVPFYDGFWIKEEDKAFLDGMVSMYIFERKFS